MGFVGGVVGVVVVVWLESGGWLVMEEGRGGGSGGDGEAR